MSAQRELSQTTEHPQRVNRGHWPEMKLILNLQ